MKTNPIEMDISLKTRHNSRIEIIPGNNNEYNTLAAKTFYIETNKNFQIIKTRMDPDTTRFLIKFDNTNQTINIRDIQCKVIWFHYTINPQEIKNIITEQTNIKEVVINIADLTIKTMATDPSIEIKPQLKITFIRKFYWIWFITVLLLTIIILLFPNTLNLSVKFSEK